LREDDIPKEDRAEVYKACESIFKRTTKDSKKDNQFNVFKMVDQTAFMEFGKTLLNESILNFDDGESKEKPTITPYRHSAVG